MNLSYCYWGPYIAISLHGDIQQVSQQANIFFNYGVTDADPVWLWDDGKVGKVYVLSTKDKLKRGLTTLNLTKLSMDKKQCSQFKRTEKGFFCLAEQLAIGQINEIKYETFLDSHSRPPLMFAPFSPEKSNDDE